MLNVENAARAGRDGQEATGAPRRRPWWVWAAPFTLILATLIARNTDLFTGRFYETADYGADSLLVEQARHFTLLVGNYSRDYFHHPGPAYLYVEAAGQSLLYNALHVVPTAWNGQVIALYVLSSALAGLAVFVVYGWLGRAGALAATAVLLGFAVLHVGVLSAAWLPYQDVPAFALFLIAAGSVAAGRGQDTWIATLAGWLLIHRYATMLLFVPVLTVVVLVLAAWPARRRPRAALRDLVRARPVWVPALVVSIVFALPIALDLILHWPGQFGMYISYSEGSTAGAHSFGTTLHYVTWFWGTGAAGWAAVVGLSVAAIAAAALTRGPLRRYLAALLVLGAVATLTFVYYAATGIDEINQPYIGYFYWAVPMTAVLVVVLAIVAAVPDRAAVQGRAGRAVTAVTAVTALAAVAAAAGFAVAPGTTTSTTHVDPESATKPGSVMDPGLPAVVRTLAADARGKTVVVYLYQNAWAAMAGFLAQADRTGVRACVGNPYWEFMVTSQFTCTPGEAARGAGFMFHPAGTRVKGVVATMDGAVITRYTPAS